MPKRVSPLSARAVDSLKEGQERADGALPGLRVRNVSGELVWSLFIVPPKAATKRRFEVGRGLALAEAREKAVELRRQVRDGKDPTTEKKASRSRAIAARDGVGTLEAIVDKYYDSGPGAALRTGTEQSKSIKRVFKPLLKRVAVEVHRAEIQLQADSYRSATSASAAIGALRPVLKWAAKRGLLKDDNWRDLEGPETHADSSKAGRRRLSGEELAKLWPKLEGPYSEASKFLLYTAARLREGTRATWAEIDLEGGTWTIAASRRKDTRSKRRVKAAPAADHVVPLPKQAIVLLRTIHERRKPKPTDLVFVGPEGGELINWSRWLAKLHETSGVNSWSAHALRRTTATMAAELGTEPHVVQAILGHRAIGNALQSLYQHSRYLPEHARALQAVADRVDAIVTGKDNVVRLRHAGTRLVNDAFAGAIPENEDQSLIRDIAVAGMPLMLQPMRRQGGCATARLNSGKVLERRMALRGLIGKLPAFCQRQLLSETTLGRLKQLMEEESWPYSRSEGTLTKDLQAIKRESKKQKVVTT